MQAETPGPGEQPSPGPVRAHEARHALGVNMAHTSARPGSWLIGWDPEDEDAWHAGGRLIARRNLVLSVLSERLPNSPQ